MSKPIKVPIFTLYRIARSSTTKGGRSKKGDTFGWRLKGANGENVCRHSQYGGFKTARSAWSNFAVTMLIGGTDLPLTTPRKGTDVLWLRGPFGRVLSEDEVTVEAQADGTWTPWLRVRRAS